MYLYVLSSRGCLFTLDEELKNSKGHVINKVIEWENEQITYFTLYAFGWLVIDVLYSLLISIFA